MNETEKQAIKTFQNLIRSNPEMFAGAGKLARKKSVSDYLAYKKSLEKIISADPDKEG